MLGEYLDKRPDWKHTKRMSFLGSSVENLQIIETTTGIQFNIELLDFQGHHVTERNSDLVITFCIVRVVARVIRTRYGA